MGGDNLPDEIQQALRGPHNSNAALAVAPRQGTFNLTGNAGANVFVVVDWTTTSQDEADRNYGRKMRKKEAREGRERRDYEKQCRKHPEQCQQGPQGQPSQQGYDGYRAGY